MWDQIRALEFVKENIEAFRGNPNLVTIAGQSTGAACVGLHLLSPRSNSIYIFVIFYYFNQFSFQKLLQTLLKITLLWKIINQKPLALKGYVIKADRPAVKL